MKGKGVSLLTLGVLVSHVKTGSVNHERPLLTFLGIMRNPSLVKTVAHSPVLLSICVNQGCLRSVSRSHFSSFPSTYWDPSNYNSHLVILNCIG